MKYCLYGTSATTKIAIVQTLDLYRRKSDIDRSFKMAYPHFVNNYVYIQCTVMHSLQIN